ncbi:hypothetical protein Lebu_0661 [Leptotrichia buccalis C-1013-b]|uniref:Uncharacterized protein n=1 Tax=Leptotrichia buccalis (strain ATCC 14201 / DSM 1135 / JCM 12969 / NCTC 10249 / C-1013-b) TaxID=523794 RepID=C7N8T8_LEPBD|nr:hypothetical protein Lebu_0661 [Leptotrichia buccalis C-1013-b]
MYNLVNSFQMPKLDIQRFERDDNSPVYMEIDEDHMRCRRSKNTYMRMVVIYIVELRKSAETGTNSLTSTQ